jgi:cell division protein YceG involved in septum cleavage
LYFVADSSLDGSSVFAATYTEHLKYAKQWHQALDRRDATRKATLK